MHTHTHCIFIQYDLYTMISICVSNAIADWEKTKQKTNTAN